MYIGPVFPLDTSRTSCACTGQTRSPDKHKIAERQHTSPKRANDILRRFNRTDINKSEQFFIVEYLVWFLIIIRKRGRFVSTKNDPERRSKAVSQAERPAPATMTSSACSYGHGYKNQFHPPGITILAPSAAVPPLPG